MTARRIVSAYYSELGRLRMLGGDRALDLANTTHWRDGAVIDFIPDYKSLIDWSVSARIISANEAQLLHGQSVQNIQEASDVLRRWLDIRNRFREHLALGAGQGATQTTHSFKPLARDLALRLGDFDKSSMFGEFGIDSGSVDLTLPLTRSYLAIMNLIMFIPQSTIRLCEGDPCGGFFIDQSRSKPRRWCAMDSCGNRAKVNRHRASTK